MIKFLISLSLVIFYVGVSSAEKEIDKVERPNILWITSEDNDYAWLGCYGNTEAHTPHLDKLAEGGVLFKNAYSNAPVCAVARSTILRGVYAVTTGTQHMRSTHKISAKYKPYVTYLREQGYYCTNKTKTDYNYDGPYQKLWDDCTRNAHYKNRPKGTSFFSVINLTVSHESSLFESRIKSNRKKKVIPNETRISANEVEIRPYLPDLPEIRSDIAIYHDNITAMDAQVGSILRELEDAGLADDTIVFYYSDHGGITPRGKRYLKETGVHVPMLLHVPEKWKHLTPFENGQKVDEMVAFVDLAPTILSLIGMEKPAQMQGRAFLGKNREEAKDDAAIFLYADRFDEFYGMRRGIVSGQGKWKYIRRFTPHLPAAPYSFYQFGQQGWVAWQKAWKDGKLPEKYAKIWQPNQLVEELYNLESDPWEIDNLALNKEHSDKLLEMRIRLRNEMVENKDSGVIPEPMFKDVRPSNTGVLTDYFDEPEVDIGELVDAAFGMSSKEYNKEQIMAYLGSASPVVRYWAAQKCITLSEEATSLEPVIHKLLTDEHSAIRISAAHAMFALGKEEEATQVLITELEKEQSEYAVLYTFNVIKQCGLSDKVPEAWIEKALKIKNNKSYVKRMAEQLKSDKP